jgi:phosphoribosylformylglycinamidine cyclo-ligase
MERGRRPAEQSESTRLESVASHQALQRGSVTAEVLAIIGLQDRCGPRVERIYAGCPGPVPIPGLGTYGPVCHPVWAVDGLLVGASCSHGSAADTERKRSPVSGDNSPVSYSNAGVDIDAGEQAIVLMRESVAAAARPEVVGGIGGFAGLFDAAALQRFDHPLLATTTDGVGTKVAIAQRMDKHDTIGVDLVAMVADDLIVCGAEPLFLTDYIACGRVLPERIAAIVHGVAQGCKLAGCALIGGETAEHPGLLGPDEYDLAGAATGVVEADQLLGADKVREGDAIIALRSSGLHSNGYSLVRRILFDLANWSLDRYVDDFGRTVGEELLQPTTIYARACLELIRRTDVHAYAHVTGGGIGSNLERVLPAHLSARIDRATWTPPPIFEVVGRLGRVDRAEMERTFNMGIGMLAVVNGADAHAATEFLASAGIPAWVVGELMQGPRNVELDGRHPDRPRA